MKKKFDILNKLLSFILIAYFIFCSNFCLKNICDNNDIAYGYEGLPSPYRYYFIPGYFGFWCEDWVDPPEYYYQEWGTQEKKYLGHEVLNGKILDDIRFTPIHIPQNYQVSEFILFKDFDGDSRKVGNYPDKDYLNKTDAFCTPWARIENEDIYKSSKYSGQTIECTVTMGLLSPESAYEVSKNTYQTFIDFIVVFVDNDYVEDPEQWKIDHGLIDAKVYADLQIDIEPENVEMNYVDFNNNKSRKVTITFDATKSKSYYEIKEYLFNVEIDGKKYTEKNKTGILEIELKLKPNQFNYLVKNYKDIKGKVKVTNSKGTTNIAENQGQVKLNVINEKPCAGYTNPSKMYCTVPFEIKNTSYDDEDDLVYAYWKIKNLDGELLFYQDIDIDEGTNKMDYNENCFTVENADYNKLKLNFKEDGYYTISISVYDRGDRKLNVPSKHDTYEKIIYVNTKPQPPTADFNMYEYGFPNEKLYIKDTSTDPNNDIIKWEWTKPEINKEDNTPAELTGSLYGNGGNLTFKKTGIYDVTLKVTDHTNLFDKITKTVKIIPPFAVARITTQGTLKENRKVTLHSKDSLSPRVDPIQTKRNIWRITPLDGQSTNSIKIDAETSNNEEKNIVFKETGRYKVYLKVHNNYSDEHKTETEYKATYIEEIIEISPDEDPTADLVVTGNSPNFKDNPIETTINIKDISYSKDEDIIDKRHWEIYRDNNGNGNYFDDGIYGMYENISKLNASIKFEQGNSAPFLAKLVVKEEFGQETIDKFVTANDRRKGETTQVFRINWIPDIKIDMPEWRYTDDVIYIKTEIKDEEIKTASVKWTLQRADKEDKTKMEEVDINKYTVQSLNNQGGSVQFIESGYYKLTAEVTDEIGQTSSYSRKIRIYPLPTAVINDETTLRWNNKPFNTKENRKYSLNGNQSYADDYYGEGLHPIDHSKDYWEIIPLNSQGAEIIKIQDGKGKILKNQGDNKTYIRQNDTLNETLLFKRPGKYKIRYQVTNEYGKKSPFEEAIISVAEDTQPEIGFEVIPIVYRDADYNKQAKLTIYQIKAKSTDKDNIKIQRLRYRFDSNNDGNFQDEKWINAVIDTKNKKAKVKKTHVGKYQFEFFIKEEFGQPSIKEFVTEQDRKENYQYKTIEVDNIRPMVDFTITPTNKVDIVFTIGEIDNKKIQQLNEKINTYVKTPLESDNTNYIDTKIKSIETSTMSTNDADAKEIFNNWSRYGSNSHTWSFNSSTKVISRDDNSYWSGFFDPNFNEDNYTLEIDFGTFGSDNDDIGISFGIKSGNPNGHLAFLLSKQGSASVGNSYKTHRHGHKAGLYQYNGSRIKNVAKHTKNFKNYQWYHLKAVVNGKNIKIWFDGEKIIDYTHTTNLKGSFGFFTNSQPNGSFKNLVVTSQTIKQLDEVLKEPTWRDDAHRFLINLSDVKLPELDNPKKYPVILSRMLNDNLYFCELGTAVNQAQMQKFIKNNDGKGTFIKNNQPNIDTALQKLAEYILKTVSTKAKPSSLYVLLNEHVNYSLYYKDLEKDPQYKINRWKYDHDPNYFENSLGKADYSSLWLTNSISKFDKVGKFTTEYRTKDNPVGNEEKFDKYRKWSEMMSGPLNIYVHRKPIAQFSVNITPIKDPGTKEITSMKISYKDTSYDLDHLSEPKKGITQWQWSWKEASSNKWNSGKLTNAEILKDYLVKLKVRDKDGNNGIGVWSDETVVLITVNAQPPVAQFSLYPATLPIDKLLTIEDNSYDPNGDKITQHEWKLYKDSKLIGTYNSTNSLRNYNQSKRGIGDYKIQLKVKDTTGLWSEIYTQNFKVTPVNHSPTADFNLISDEKPSWTFPKIVGVLPSGIMTTLYRPASTVFHEEKTKFNENIKDPDTDNTGFSYHWTLERYNAKNISGISGTPDDIYTYTTKTPFVDSFINKGLKSGAYKITLKITDKPPVPPYKNTDKKTVYTTKKYYIIPQISMTAGFTTQNKEEIQVGDIIKLKAETSKEVEKVTCKFNGKHITLKNTKNNSTKEWEIDYVIPDTIAKSSRYYLEFTGETTYGGNGKVTRKVENIVPIDIVALKLINFRITDIVNHPHLTYPITKNMLQKKLIQYKAGYYVTFKINAKGKPTNVKAKIEIGENGHIDQTINMKRVDTDGLEQIYEGRFYTNARLKKDTIISIELEANKDKNFYNYNIKEGWNGRSLIVKGSVFQDVRINLTN